MRHAIFLAAVPTLLSALSACERPESAESPAVRTVSLEVEQVVEPAFLAGNQTCSDVIGAEAYDCEIVIPSPYDGSFPYTCGDAAGEILIDTHATPEGATVDFDIEGTRDVALYAVVKGGPNANGYDYRPDGVDEDFGLHAPVNPKNGAYYGLSHVSLCIEERPCELIPTLTLYESCEEELGYSLALDLNGEPLALPDASIDVDIVYDCGAGPIAIAEPVLPDGSVAVPVDLTTDCLVTATFAGLGGLEGCGAETSGIVTIWPVLEAQGTLSQTCDGTYGWNTSIEGGSGASSVLWSFDVTDGGVGSEATSTDPSGVAVLASGLVDDALVEAQLQVTDGAVRDSAVGPLSCIVMPSVQSITARRPLSVQIVPTTGDGTCPADDVQTVLFDATVLGGSGEWTLQWAAGGDAVLDPTCAAAIDVSDPDSWSSLACSFELGDGFCAGGDITLTVVDDDTACAPAHDDISAIRTATLDVNPTP